MIGITAMAERLSDWAVETLPELGTRVTDYASGQKKYALPDLAVEIQSVEMRQADPADFPELSIEQAFLRVYAYDLLLVADPADEQAASDQLSDFVDRLTQSGVDDATLGGRVPGVALTFSASFTPPFVEFDDGTRGRLATLSLTVGEPIEVEE